MDAPRSPAPLSLKEPALPRSAARRTAAQTPGRGGCAGAGLRGQEAVRGSRGLGLSRDPRRHTGAQKHTPPPCCGVCGVFEFAHSRTWKGLCLVLLGLLTGFLPSHPCPPS